MRKCIFCFIIFLSFLRVASFGQDIQPQHPIDIKYQACLDSNSSTIGTLECLSSARQDWDKELNKYYKLLMKELNQSGQLALRKSQKQWIIYKETETKFYLGLYTKKEGTMWNVVMARRGMDIIRTRAIELIEYYETITQN
jgi:uncharacterized protein YecT (DUF1311 family)